MRTLKFLSACSILALMAALAGADVVPPHARAPDAWDEESYLADVHGYLEKVIPGRAFQAAPAGTCQPLEVVGPRGHTVPSGTSVWLKVRTEPGLPVTFSSLQMGGFKKNGQATISVKAGDDGVAKAKFQATPGTAAFVEIIAASPMRCGQVGFVIEILDP